MSSKTVADQFDVMLETAEGFTLSMIKAGISGRRDEDVDLAKINLWR